MTDLTSDFLGVVLAMLVGNRDTFLMRCFHRHLSWHLVTRWHGHFVAFSMMDGAEGVHAVSFGYLVAMRNGGLHRDFMANFVGDDFTGRACRSVSVIAIPMMSAIPRISFSLGLSLGLTSPTMTVGQPVGVMASSVGVVVSRVRLADLLFHRFTFLCIGDFNVGTTYFFVAGMALFVWHL